MFNLVAHLCLTLPTHGLQHARLPCPLPTPRACSNSCSSSWWWHPTISSCHPLLLPLSIFPSIRVFSNGSVLRIRWPKYWSFSFSIIPCKEHPGLVSFRMDLLDLLAVQGTPKNLLQHHSSKSLSHINSLSFLWAQLLPAIPMADCWFMLIYGRKQHNIVRQLSPN